MIPKLGNHSCIASPCACDLCADNNSPLNFLPLDGYFAHEDVSEIISSCKRDPAPFSFQLIWNSKAWWDCCPSLHTPPIPTHTGQSALQCNAWLCSVFLNAPFLPGTGGWWWFPIRRKLAKQGVRCLHLSPGGAFSFLLTCREFVYKEDCSNLFPSSTCSLEVQQSTWQAPDPSFPSAASLEQTQNKGIQLNSIKPPALRSFAQETNRRLRLEKAHTCHGLQCQKRKSNFFKTVQQYLTIQIRLNANLPPS